MVACGTDSGNGCAGAGYGDLTPSQILNAGAGSVQEDRAIYNYSVTHADYNYILDSELDDTQKFIVANAIFLGNADSISRQPSLSDRVTGSAPIIAHGLSLSVAGLIAGGGGNGSQQAKGGVYTITNPSGKVVRVGHTKNFVSRMGNYARDNNYFDLKFNIEYQVDDYATRRGLEQKLYDKFQPPMNKNRPIRIGNGNANEYLRKAEEFLGGLLGRK